MRPSLEDLYQCLHQLEAKLFATNIALLSLVEAHATGASPLDVWQLRRAECEVIALKIQNHASDPPAPLEVEDLRQALAAQHAEMLRAFGRPP